MKKVAICAMVLALAVAIVPQSNATSCVHFTNFCDSIQANISVVGGISGKMAYGGWDFLCTGNWTDASVIGNSATLSRIGTRPYSVTYAYLDAYSFQFAFQAHTQLFDLYGTNGGTTITAFQTNQPWSIGSGTCRAGDIKHGMPRLSSVSK